MAVKTIKLSRLRVKVQFLELINCYDIRDSSQKVQPTRLKKKLELRCFFFKKSAKLGRTLSNEKKALRR